MHATIDDADVFVANDSVLLPGWAEVERRRRAVEGSTLSGQLHLVLVAPVVEPRVAFEPEAHLPPHHLHHAHQAVLVGCPTASDRTAGDRTAGNRHEVDDLAHAICTEKSGDEDGRAR